MKLGLIVGVALLMSMPSFAAITACPTTTTALRRAVFYAACKCANGCTSMNLQFANFSVGSINGGLGGANINGVTIEANSPGYGYTAFDQH